MKPRSPLTDISVSELNAILGKGETYGSKIVYKGAPCRKEKTKTFPFYCYRFNLYSLLGWYKNQRDALLYSASNSKGRAHQSFRGAASKLEKNINILEQYISTYKQTHTMPKIETTEKPNTPKTTVQPKPFKQYPADRRMLTGDSVWTQLFFGRSNGLTSEQLNRAAIVTKDEDNFGCVLVRFDKEENVHSIPVCNLKLIRAVEDIPVLSIIADQYAFYITTKGVSEAVAAFWYGGKTGRLREDARALAELNLDLLHKENA